MDSSQIFDRGWQQVLEPQFKMDYFLKLQEFIKQEQLQYVIYPEQCNIFEALNQTPFHKVKVVILGQDPYHNPDQAHGLSFSVSKNTKKPPSLKNIYNEIETDLGLKMSNNGNLSAWAEQGVLLLNSVLTVRKNQPSSHSNQGWETFTDAIIKAISDALDNVVFLLWGNYAKKKAQWVDAQKHHILTTTHPSPFSVHRGFYGCKHFSKTNALLIQSGLNPIKWEID